MAATSGSRPDPLALLDSALELLAAGRAPEADATLRTALGLRPGYTFHARAAALVSALWRESPPALRQARVALLGASTTALLRPVLRALCFRDGIAAEFHEGLYGGYRQEILDPASALYRFAPTVAFIVPHWRDLALPPVSENEDEAVERVVLELGQLWTALRERAGCHVVQHAFDFPAHESHDYTAAAPGGRTRVIARINEELARRAHASVSVLDAASVQREVGGAAWQDERLWHLARQHPAPAALPALAELQAAHLRAALGLARKVVVTDLDNTLWGGIIGEDGVSGIRVGAGSPAGEAHADLQEYLRELKERGVLLAVCSKNNPADARLAFERHPRMRLRLDDFAAFFANWEDKAQNIRSIATALSLGTDSFVLLDDNPAERAWIRAQLPEVAVVELGPTPFSYVRDLDAGRYFFSFSVTDEDRRRAGRYRGDAARQALRARFASIDDFLRDLQMHAACVPVGPATIARVTQLVNKTNQFNLTARRRQTAEIESTLAEPGAWGAAFALADRFGDHGLISAVICTCPEPGTWEIDTWVVSCRVLGRGVERFIAERILEAARADGIRRIVGIFRPTGRNALVETLYPQLGFAPLPGGPDEARYECLVDGASLPAHSIAHQAAGGEVAIEG
jgi:FkbH-like protein